LGTLTLADLGALSEELTGCLVSADDLELFLAVKIGKELAVVAKPGTLPIRVFDALRTADKEGWIGKVIHAAAAKWPPGPVMQRLLATVPAEPPPRAVKGDLSTYDMTEQVQLVRQAMYRSRCKVVGVVVHEVGNAYLDRLYERVVGELGASRRKTWLKLDATFKDGATVAKDVRLSVKTLASKPLVVGVRVPRNCVAEVTPLMAALEPESEKWARHLVVILAADPSDVAALPPAITRLKSPTIEEVDVIDWVDRLVADIAEWPFTRSQQLVAAICQRAGSSADCWDRLYAELENTVIGLE
jgi:hypothetical protein